MQKLLQRILKILATAIVRKFQPIIIGITGSVGKTSTKNAVIAALKSQGNLGYSLKNYNNEIGLPLTIIGSKAAGRNVLKWLLIFFRAVCLLLFPNPNYPRVLILEMAADKPGDITYLLDIAPASIGVVTAIGEAHLEFFVSIENLIREKQSLVAKIPESGLAVLNRDDDKVWEMRKLAKAKIKSFGFNKESTFRGLEPKVWYEENKPSHLNSHQEIGVGKDFRCGGKPKGMYFKISAEGSVVPVFLPNVLGEGMVLSFLAAAAVAKETGLNFVEIIENLKSFEAPAGRMRLLDGIKQTTLIDDSYNSSSKACELALKTLAFVSILEGAERFAVLGDMLELGPTSVDQHRNIGKYAASLKIDWLITVGEGGRNINNGAKEAGMKEDRAFHFSSNLEAGKFVQDKLQKNDLVLIKASRAMHFEEIAKELMAEPLRAKELLAS